MPYEFYEELKPALEKRLKGTLGKGLGQGTFSIVYAFERDGFEQSAVKVLRVIEEYGEEPSLPEELRKAYQQRREARMEVYKNEIRCMYQLQSCPYVMPCWDYGFLDWTVRRSGDDCRFGCDMYIKMPLSRSLNEVIKRHGRFTEKGVVHVGACIAKALIACWKEPGKRILHRDIKPANIFLRQPDDPSSDYLLGDFGISRKWNGSVEDLTTAQGTVSFMAPEQKGPLVDLYSLGLTLYVLANGNRHPFPQNDLIRQENRKPLPPPVNASPALSEVILKACAYRPQDRYQSPMEFLKALQQVPCEEDQPDYTMELADQVSQDPDATEPARPGSIPEEPAERLPEALAYVWEKRYLEEGFPDTFQPRALQGEPEAQYLLGYCYDHGAEIRDYHKAIDWYRKACASEYPPAQYELGNCYFYGKGTARNLMEAVKWYRLAAKEYGWASCRLGDCCLKGTGVEQDEEKAAEWYEQAIQRGVREPYVRLGDMLCGMERPSTADLQKSISYCREGVGKGVAGLEGLINRLQLKYWAILAEEGDIAAARNLGDCYYNGQGVEKDDAKAVYWYEKAALEDPKAQYQLGVCHSSGRGVPRDYTEAVRWARKAAEQGDADSQHLLGECYFFGKGVERDIEEAKKWFRKAADQNHIHAQYDLGLCYLKGGAVKKVTEDALFWFRKAADQNMALSQYVIGMMYYSWKGDQKQDAIAVEWMEKAVAQGLAVAQYALGTFYFQGHGVPQNMEKAVELYWKAAMQNDLEGQFQLGECFLHGWGVAENEASAVYWYEKAAENGQAIAQYLMGQYHEKGHYVKKDQDAAMEWYRKSAEQGYQEAQFRLGVCYDHGYGVRRNDQEKMKWFHRAAEQGHMESQYALGCCYHFGYGIQQDFEEAVVWFRKAAVQGHEESQYFLGTCLCNGVGAKQDVEEGAMWLRRAMNQEAPAQNMNWKTGVCL